MSIVVSGDFCRFKLVLPSLLFLSKDEVKAAHSDFDRCPREEVCAPKILPIGIFLGRTLRSKIIAPCDMSPYQNSPRISLKTSVSKLHFQVRFSLAILLSVNGHGRDLGLWSIFSLPRVVRSINVQYLPYPQRDTSPYSIVLINQSESEVELNRQTRGKIWIFCGVCCERLSLDYFR